MDKALFERLTHSMAQMNEIIEGKFDNNKIRDNLRAFIDENVSLQSIVDKYDNGFSGILSVCL